MANVVIYYSQLCLLYGNRLVLLFALCNDCSYMAPLSAIYITLSTLLLQSPIGLPLLNNKVGIDKQKTIYIILKIVVN